MPGEANDAAAEQLRVHLERAREGGDDELSKILSAREGVISRFSPVFASVAISDLSEAGLRSFLRFKNNKHWTRLGRHAIEDMGAVRTALAVLVDESRPIKDRLNDLGPGGVTEVSGLKEGTLTPILLIAHPDQYGVWNKPAEKAMVALGLWPRFRRGSRLGDKYVEVNRVLLAMRDVLDVDLWTLDALWWRHVNPIGGDRDGRLRESAIRDVVRAVAENPGADVDAIISRLPHRRANSVRSAHQSVARVLSAFASSGMWPVHAETRERLVVSGLVREESTTWLIAREYACDPHIELPALALRITAVPHTLRTGLSHAKATIAALVELDYRMEPATWEGRGDAPQTLAAEGVERTGTTVSRPFQVWFRGALIEADGCRCAMTGATAKEALEAAHLVAFGDGGPSTPDNGLLLRADVHRLFDSGRIRIDPDSGFILIDSDLQRDRFYGELHGRQIPLSAARKQNLRRREGQEPR